MSVKKINIKYIVLFLNMSLLFAPAYITHSYPIIRNFVEIYSIVLVCIYASKTIKAKKNSKIILLILLLCIVQIISSLYNNNGVSNSIMDMIKIISPCLLINYELQHDPNKLIKTSMVYFTTTVVINVITIILYPNGLYLSNISKLNQNWFLGYKNSHILYIFPMYLFTLIFSTVNTPKMGKGKYLIMAIGLLNIILIHSSTSFIVALLAIVYVTPFKKIFERIKAINVLIIYFISNYMIIFSKINKVLGWIVSTLFKKDLTFTGRTFIWDKTLSEIKSKPLLGHGDISIKFESYTTTFSSSHNLILENLYKFGWIGMIVFAVVLLFAMLKLDKANKNLLYPLLVILLISILVATISESYVLNMIMYLFVIFYNIDHLTKNRGEKNEKTN